jgi:small subunit ribosomal protein S16
LNLDSAVKWLHNGAQPTDTAKAILSYKGALLKHHLDGGIRKGALTQEQADAKLATWLEAKAGKVDAKKDGLTKAQADAKTKAFKAEQAVNAKRLATAAQAEVEATQEEVVAEEASPEAEVETVEEVVAETPEAEVATEEVIAVTETPEVEATEEVVETPAAEDPSSSEQAEQNNEATEA